MDSSAFEKLKNAGVDHVDKICRQNSARKAFNLIV